MDGYERALREVTRQTHLHPQHGFELELLRSLGWTTDTTRLLMRRAREQAEDLLNIFGLSRMPTGKALSKEGSGVGLQGRVSGKQRQSQEKGKAEAQTRCFRVICTGLG